MWSQCWLGLQCGQGAASGRLQLGSAGLHTTPHPLTTRTHPPGCCSGKSSLFRVAAGLWPLQAGEVTLPPRGELFYLSQVCGWVAGDGGSGWWQVVAAGRGKAAW